MRQIEGPHERREGSTGAVIVGLLVCVAVLWLGGYITPGPRMKAEMPMVAAEEFTPVKQYIGGSETAEIHCRAKVQNWRRDYEMLKAASEADHWHAFVGYMGPCLSRG